MNEIVPYRTNIVKKLLEKRKFWTFITNIKTLHCYYDLCSKQQHKTQKKNKIAFFTHQKICSKSLGSALEWITQT